MGKPSNAESVFDEMKCALSYIGVFALSRSQMPPTS
jgi:hypothetical protein